MSLGDMVNDCYGAIKHWQEAISIKEDTHKAKAAKIDFIEESLQELNKLLEKLDLEEKQQDAQTLLNLLVDLNKKDAMQKMGFNNLLKELKVIVERELPKAEVPATVSATAPEFKLPLTKKRERLATEIDVETTLAEQRRGRITRSTVTLLSKDTYIENGVIKQANYGLQRCAANKSLLDKTDQSSKEPGKKTMSPTLSF